MQERVAKAEAAVRSARAFLYEMVHEIWGIVEQGARLTEQQLALFRLANMHAVSLVPRQSIWCTMRLARVRSLPPIRLSASSGTSTSPPNTDARPPKSCIRRAEYVLGLPSQA